MAEAAVRPPGVDLEEAWQGRRARFPAMAGLGARVRVRIPRRQALERAALAVTGEGPDVDGWLVLDRDFADLSHAAGVLWGLSPDVEALEPAPLRTALAQRAGETASRYGVP